MASKYCIYKHTNKKNGKVYIGQTCQSPEKRWGNGNNYVGSPHFFSAINKYGWCGFTHEVLYTELTLEEANVLEAKIIEQYNSTNREKGYNDRKGGNNYSPSETQRAKMSTSRTGKKQSKETIEKRVKKNTGKKRTDEQRKRLSDSSKKKVVCVNTGDIFNSMLEAAEWCGGSSPNITKVCRGERKSCGKIPKTGEKAIWRYMEVVDNEK